MNTPFGTVASMVLATLLAFAPGLLAQSAIELDFGKDQTDANVPKHTFLVGQSITLSLKRAPATPSEQTVSWNTPADFIEKVAEDMKGDKATGTFRIKAAHPATKWIITWGGIGRSAEVTSEKLTADRILFKASDDTVAFKATKDGRTKILLDDKCSIQIEGLPAGVEASLTASTNGIKVSKLQVEALKAGPTMVTVSAAGSTEPLLTMNLEVVNPVVSLRVKDKAEILGFVGDTPRLPEILGAKKDSQLATPSDYEFDYDKEMLEIKDGHIRFQHVSVDPTRPRIIGVRVRSKVDPSIKVCSGTVPEAVYDSFQVAVFANPGTVVFDNPTPTLVPGQVIKIRASQVLEDRSINKAAEFTWKLGDKKWEDHVKFTEGEDGSVTVMAAFRAADIEGSTSALQEPISLIATLRNPVLEQRGLARIGTVFLRPQKPGGFELLNVKLNMIDDQTAADLFGKKTAHEYYVASVRLLNNVADSQSGNYIQSSILAFSESIEVGVRLEKRDLNNKNAKWEPLLDKEYETLASTFDVLDDCAPKTPKRPPIPIQVASIRPQPGFAGVQSLGGPEEKNKCQYVKYRPYSYEMMVNTVDPRDSRTFRSRTFRTLDSMGLAASSLTSIAIPGPGNDLPLALDKFSNLLIPGFSKIFPSLKDTQRQNVVNMTMRQIEEIPFGSDVSRIIFLPKSAFSGVLPFHKVRIGQIDPYQFKIKVAVLSKGNVGTVGPR